MTPRKHKHPPLPRLGTIFEAIGILRDNHPCPVAKRLLEDTERSLRESRVSKSKRKYKIALMRWAKSENPSWNTFPLFSEGIYW